MQCMAAGSVSMLIKPKKFKGKKNSSEFHSQYVNEWRCPAVEVAIYLPGGGLMLGKPLLFQRPGQ